MINAVLLIFLAGTLFLIPVVMVSFDLADPNIRRGEIPAAAWKLYRALTPKYAKWAHERTASDRAIQLSTSNISGTEWPLFGSVFYLLAIESLQDAWEADHSLSPVEPKVFAHDAIEAATQLVIDPKQAGWVKTHWGENYLNHENAFYRMLLISALTSHARLTGKQEHLDFLRSQVEGLSAEIVNSHHGLLEDYPGQCYPGDVLMAIAMIHKANQTLGRSDADFVTKALRGFQNERLDDLGLVPYSADAGLGKALGSSRGCGNSYVSLFAPYLWPDQARKWYDTYAENFWQGGGFTAGFREFPKGLPGHDWYIDVDSGPVFTGYGVAACAFGLGGARANGRFDHAYPLTAELYFTSWPMPNRTLLLPRLLSNAADAPYLGEAAILFVLTRTPVQGLQTTAGGSIPAGVMVGLAIQFTIGLVVVWLVVRSAKKAAKRPVNLTDFPNSHFAIWLCLLGLSLVLFLLQLTLYAAVFFFAAQFFPRSHKQLREVK